MFEVGALIKCGSCGFVFMYTNNNKGKCLKCGGECSAVAKSKKEACTDSKS